MFPAKDASQDMMLTHGPGQQQALAAQLSQLCPALCECAGHVAAGRIADANRCFDRIKDLASLADGPLQRLASIMADGLVRSLLRLTTGISRALADPSSYFDRRSVRTARRYFFELVPFLKVGYVAINRAILDAMENEKFVHIIDLSGPAAHPWQWLKLMHAFHARPEGAPDDLRITVVHDGGAFLATISALLRKKAESLDMAFSFHGFLGRLETLDFGNLHHALAIRSGYARAFSCALQMHRLLAVNDTPSNSGVAQLQQLVSMAQVQQLAAASCPGASSFVQYVLEMIKLNLHPSPTTPLSPSAQTPSPQCLVPRLLTSFLSALRALSPKRLVLMEQDASHNGLDFMERFREALHYYAELFDALDTAAAECQVHEERAQVEQMLLGEEIKNMLMRDGVARHERHERLHQWAVRMANAGFGSVQLSYIAKMEADEVLWKRGLTGRGYENREQEGCLLLCRSERPLYSVSVWRPWTLEASASAGSSQQQQMVLPGPMTATWTLSQQQGPVHNFTA